MTATTTGTRETRWESARERADRLGVRLQCIEPRQRYQTASQSVDDTLYVLQLVGARWTCDCPGFTYTGVCKHVAALKRRAESEGWEARS